MRGLVALTLRSSSRLRASLKERAMSNVATKWSGGVSVRRPWDGRAFIRTPVQLGFLGSNNVRK